MNCDCFTEGQKVVVVIGSVCGLYAFIALCFAAFVHAVNEYSKSDYQREKERKD